MSDGSWDGGREGWREGERVRVRVLLAHSKRKPTQGKFFREHHAKGQPNKDPLEKGRHER